jgi:sulfonate transport system ATP-binding protein
MIIVTHDVEEAVAFGDRVLVLGEPSGRIRNDFVIGLPRARERVGSNFQDWKKTILKSLEPSLIDEAVTFENEEYS